MTISPAVDNDQVFAIAQDVFSAMVDGEAGPLQPWAGGEIVFEDQVAAWVDLHGLWPGRAALVTETATAHALARALLGMGDDEEITREDLVDAFGEVANVVGGNLKSLLPTPGALSLPQVAAHVPADDAAMLVQETRLAWRGSAIVFSVWFLPSAQA